MLLTKTVIQKWNSANKKWFEGKGYAYTKMKDEFEVKVEDLNKGANVWVRVECDCKDCTTPTNKLWSWVDYLKQVREDGKTYCRRCAKKLYGGENMRKTKLENGKTFEKWCIENNRQDILNLWDYELNNCSPKDIGYGTTKNRYWFKCPRGLHESEIKNINQFTNGEGEITCKKCNSFAQHLIDLYGENALELYWDFNKNTVNPWIVSWGNNKKVWIKCQEKYHHESYDIRCFDFAYGQRCYECSREEKESLLQEKVRLYLNELGYKLLHEHKCTIVPINPKTKMPLPFDNEITNTKLIIEINGIQHYEVCGIHIMQSKYNNTTVEYELHYQKLKDRYKKFIAYKRGYNYIAIPYWTDNDDKEWKNLINNKIKIIHKEQQKLHIKINKDKLIHMDSQINVRL